MLPAGPGVWIHPALLAGVVSWGEALQDAAASQGVVLSVQTFHEALRLFPFVQGALSVPVHYMNGALCVYIYIYIGFFGVFFCVW